MIYREAGQFKATYQADQAIFPIAQDRFVMLALLVIAFLVVPFVASEYVYRAVLIPVVILALAAIGLNVLMGYCGQVSLGSGAFMGGRRLRRLQPRDPPAVPQPARLHPAERLRRGGGRHRLRHPEPAHQGLLSRLRDPGGAVLRRLGVPAHQVVHQLHAVGLGQRAADPAVRLRPVIADRELLIALCFALVVLGLAAKNIVRGHIGRQWMAIRDMDIAAEIIGVRPMYAKLTAFAVSSFLIGVAGAMWAFLYLGSWEPAAFSIDRSFQLMFMVIIGGLGSILGSVLGAVFIVLLPIFLNQALPPLGALVGWKISTATVSHFESMIFGALIVFFLVVEPHGLARLWSVAKEKLRLWPFPH